jgi:hypothetical protein
LVYPNPLNRQRYVCVFAATAPSAQFYHYDVAGQMFDFYVDDGHYDDSRTGIATERLFVAAGVFDRNWRRSDDLTFLGDPDLRAKARVRQPASAPSAR